jgi:cullin 1
VLIEEHLENFQTEFRKLLSGISSNDNLDDLGRMYHLVARIPYGLAELRSLLEGHIVNEGLSAIADAAQRSPNGRLTKFATTIWRLHGKYATLIKSAFHNDAGFVGALGKACGKFINCNAVTKATDSSSAHLLAKYCELVVKKIAKDPEEAVSEDTWNKVAGIFLFWKNSF